jgi:RNA polymerase sigma-70 factor, ECF subfamily
MSASLSRSQEQALIARAGGGDRFACDALIRAHQQSVYGYILRLCGRPELAEDVVQEAFVRVLTNLDRFDPRFRFSTWLFTIARRVMLNQLEKRRPRSDSDRVGDAQGRVSPQSLHADVKEHRATCRDSIQRALMLLSDDQREVVVLFHQHEWPIWLISQHLNMPEGTVKSHLHRGRTRLREALSADAPDLTTPSREEAPQQ